MKKNNVIKNKSFNFALRIVKLSQHLTSEKKEFIIAKQILRCGTSVGALVRESEYAESKADFVHKLMIALKEANETEYWLELLKQADYIDEASFVSISNDLKEILRLLVSITKTSKENNTDKSKSVNWAKYKGAISKQNPEEIDLQSEELRNT